MLLLKSSSKKFIVTYAYLREQKNLKQPNLILKEQDKKQQTKHKISRKEEIIKTRVEINDIQTRKPREKINETKSWFFEKITLINLWTDPSGKEGKGSKSIKLERKKK